MRLTEKYSMAYTKITSIAACKNTPILFTNIIFFITVICFTDALLKNYSKINNYVVNNSVPREIVTNANPDFFKDFQWKNTIKYVLLWTPPEEDSNYPHIIGYGAGENECTGINCYVTDNKNFFGGDLTRFHALAFNGWISDSLDDKDLPQVRTSKQKYIYGNSESPDYYPITKKNYDDYFNWTFTFKLDSDFIFRYYVVKNKKGDVVGPANNVTWEEIYSEVPDSSKNSSNFEIKTDIKNKAAAWFVTHCSTLGGREFFVEELNQALKKYNLKVDVFGPCGDMRCSKFVKEQCYYTLKRDYFFYLAMENSFASDYVTEKVVTALNNDVVPVVYGGANYSKFLPPNSYINASTMKPTQLAKMMHKLMNNIPLYLKYFEWRKYYTFELAVNNVCKFCEAIHNRSKFEAYSSYKEIRKWWNAN